LYEPIVFKQLALRVPFTQQVQMNSLGKAVATYGKEDRGTAISHSSPPLRARRRI
jgi:hypothetical protein